MKNKSTTSIRIGIIISNNNKEDLLAYKKELTKIGNELNNLVTIVLFGLKEKDIEWVKKIGFKFELVQQVSIKHYFKQLKALNLNLLFIPLIKNNYNATSEDYNKFLEAGLLKIPCLTINIYPYNEIIKNRNNGFLFDEIPDLFLIVKTLCAELTLINRAGEEAYYHATHKFNYSEENINLIDNLFI